MQMIMSNQKRHLTKSQVKILHIPLWPELAVKRIWQQAVLLEGFADFMPPDWTGENSKTERGFFWGILTTMASEYVEELIKDCRRQRIGAAAERSNEPRVLNVAPDWAAALLSQRFVSSK